MLWGLTKGLLRLVMLLRRPIRWVLKWGLRFLVVVVVFAAAGGAYVVWRAMPVYSGAAALPGLGAEVRVWRDGYGVPHIFAATMDDATRALGYLHASERLFQMETQRRIGAGRVAELYGADLLGVDKFVRTLGFYREAEASYAALAPFAQKRLDAYAAGVNAFLETRADALPPEFLIIGDKPEPWKPADSLVWGKLMALDLSGNYKLEALRAELAAKLGPDKAAWFFPGAGPEAPITTQPIADTKHTDATPPERDPLDVIGEITGLKHGASNEWVVAGARTVTGKPILANDPHLELGAPILWYLARIVTPEGSVKGATVPGTPVVLLGQSDHAAWGFTTSYVDTEDLFVETVDPANPAQYLTPDGPKPFETRDETIRVKGAPDVTLHVRATRHGPVLSDVSPALKRIAPEGKVVALAFAGLSDRDTTTEAALRLDAAQNWDEFLAAMKLFVTPSQNVVFADDAGDIGFFSPGQVPLRKAGDGLTPVDGASGAYDWTGFVPFEQLPQGRNPEAGFFFNANNANVADDHQPTFGRDWDENFRARRVQQLFDAIDKHSLDTSAAMQADHLSLAAKEFLPFLKDLAPVDARARQALTLLAAWDGVMDKGRAEPLIFAATLKALRRILLDEKTGVDMEEKGPFAATTLFALMRDHPEWCGGDGKPDPGCKATLGRALDEALAGLVKRDGADMSAWRWGDEHMAILRHRLYSHLPLLDRLTDLSLPSSGGYYTLDRGGGDAPPDKPLARTHAAGYRGLYDLADPAKSRFMITTGQSGHVFSPHYGDLVPLWNDVKSIALTGAEGDLARAGAQKLTLRPR